LRWDWRHLFKIVIDQQLIQTWRRFRIHLKDRSRKGFLAVFFPDRRGI
jgi:hypothetical protein